MRKIGLALGGGGAKGWVHIGLLRYLEEHNYLIQEIAGTSMGAIIGCCIAIGWDSQQIYEYFDTIGYRDIIDIDRQATAIQGDKILAMLEEVFGTTTFEELAIPVRVVAADIHTGEEVVFRSGLIIDALRYSMSIPGLFSLYHDKAYIDGGLVNNLPINHLTQPICIASSAVGFGKFTFTKQKKTLGIPRSETVLGRKQRLLMRSLLILLRHQEDLLLEQVKIQRESSSEQSGTIHLLRPNTAEIAPFDFSALQEAVDIGYTESVNILGEV